MVVLLTDLHLLLTCLLAYLLGLAPLYPRTSCSTDSLRTSYYLLPVTTYYLLGRVHSRVHSHASKPHLLALVRLARLLIHQPGDLEYRALFGDGVHVQDGSVPRSCKQASG